MSNQTLTFTYTATAIGQSGASLLAAAQAVPLDLDLPRMLGLLPVADFCSFTGLTGLSVIRTIALYFGVYGTIGSGNITLDTGETASPIRAVTLPGGLGNSYGAPPITTFSDSHGSGAQGFLKMGVGNVEILAGGSGYTAPVATLVGGQLDPKGTPGQVTLSLTGGSISGFTIVNPGSGYQTFPNLQITDPTGSGAVLVAGLKPVSFSLQHRGRGYKSPSIAITPFFPFNTPDSSNQAGIVKGYMLQALNQGTRTTWSEAVSVS